MTAVSPLSTASSSHWNFPLLHIVCFPLEKSRLPGISTKHRITRWNKVRHKSSCQALMRQSNRKKRVPGASEWVKSAPLPLLGVAQNPQAKQPQAWRRSGTVPCRLHGCCFSFCVSLWALLSWFCGVYSPGFLKPSGYCDLSFPSSTLIIC